MSRKPISMRKIKEILRLKFENGLSSRSIGRSCKVGRTTVQEYLGRLTVAGLKWADAKDLPEEELEARMFPGNVSVPGITRILPDWGEIHLERKKPGVTLQLLWEEYRGKNPDGLGYSRFCELYQEHVRTLDVRMRQTHKAGDKVFVDYSGDRGEIVNPDTGEILHAEIFVAVLGASNYTFAEATMTQNLRDWIGSHIRAFEFFQGVPALIVPDNLKSGVTRPCYYDPDINPTFAAFAEHYHTAVLPARVGKPRDKPKVEGGVLLAQRWILARLRHQRFFSLADLNAAIRLQLVDFNPKPFQALPGCRKSAYEQLDKPALRPLPTTPFEFADWKGATVNIDYHVEFDHHYYSVPYQLVHQKVQIRATEKVIEAFQKGQRIASHIRSREHGKHTTLSEHMPPQHKFGDWTPGRFLNWALEFGDQVVLAVKTILESKAHPEQGFRACLGIMRLGKKVGATRLNAACRRALFFKSPRFRTIQTILENSQESRPLPEATQDVKLPPHVNLRGSGYFGPKGAGEEKGEKEEEDEGEKGEDDVDPTDD